VKLNEHKTQSPIGSSIDLCDYGCACACLFQLQLKALLFTALVYAMMVAPASAMWDFN